MDEPGSGLAEAVQQEIDDQYVVFFFWAAAGFAYTHCTMARGDVEKTIDGQDRMMEHQLRAMMRTDGYTPHTLEQGGDRIVGYGIDSADLGGRVETPFFEMKVKQTELDGVKDWLTDKGFAFCEKAEMGGMGSNYYYAIAPMTNADLPPLGEGIHGAG